LEKETQNVEESDCVIIRDERCSITLHRPRHIYRENAGSTIIARFEHQIDIVAGAFRGSLNGAAYVNGWGRFLEQLNHLYTSLTGTASLGGYENVEIEMKGDGRGHLTVAVQVTDDHLRPILLKFSVFLDQTQLPRIQDDIERVFARLDQ
jgi:hypothetical protein